MKIRLLDLAQQDLQAAYRFYESQAEGLGTYFLTDLFRKVLPFVVKAFSLRYLLPVWAESGFNLCGAGLS